MVLEVQSRLCTFESSTKCSKVSLILILARIAKGSITNRRNVILPPNPL